MNHLRPGDAVIVRGPDDDGFPSVRYGVIHEFHPRSDAEAGTTTATVLMDHGPITVAAAALRPLRIDEIELTLPGTEVLDDPELRRGLVALWAAEVTRSGLAPIAIHSTGAGLRDSSEGYLIAEVATGVEHLVLRAVRTGDGSDAVRIRAERPNRWDT